MPRLRPAPEQKEDPKKVEAAVVAEPEVEVEEPQVEVAEPEPEVAQPDEATVALQKQLEDLKKSEQLAREQITRERDEAIQRAREREAQLSRVQKESQEYQVTSIDSALAAAKAEISAAKRDIKAARDLGDVEAELEADERRIRAVSNLVRLEEGKEAIEARAKEAPQQQQTQVDIVDTWGLPPNTSSWLKANRDFISSQDRIDALKYWANKAAKNGLAPHTTEHIEWVGQKMREELGLSQPKQEIQVQQPAQQQQRSSVVSAPVSREVPASDGKRDKGKVTLTREEQEFARVSGVTLEEYAKQKQKYQEMRANGQYGEQR